MAERSVRYRKQLALLGDDAQRPYPILDGIAKVKEMAQTGADRSYKNGKKRKKVDQTVEIVVQLGIDARQAEQAVRGAISLPKGTGQTQRVIAFCDPELAEKAKAAGAIEAGVDELIERITKGWADFDVAVAHPQMMGKVGKLGRILGPSGKMPSPKAGTVTQDVVTAVREYTAGKLEYRNDAGGNVHLRVGKASFAPEDLRENIQAVIDHLHRIKPASAKGTYMKGVFLSANQTPAVRLEVA